MPDLCAELFTGIDYIVERVRHETAGAVCSMRNALHLKLELDFGRLDLVGSQASAARTPG